MIKEILEQLAPLDAQIAALKGSGNDMEAITAHASELAELAVEEDEILRSCGPLTAEDRVFLARHPERPHIDETVSALFTDFFEQRGDRQCKEDSAILGGVARFHGLPVTVIGHRKGSTLEENLACNFGMPGPEGYRKALRLMKQAEKFGRPIITFIASFGSANALLTGVTKTFVPFYSFFPEIYVKFALLILNNDAEKDYTYRHGCLLCLCRTA